MKTEELKKLSNEELKKKENSLKVMVGIFIPLILLLFFFVFRDYFENGEFDTGSLIIPICSVGGLVALLPELKSVQQEIKSRKL